MIIVLGLYTDGIVQRKNPVYGLPKNVFFDWGLHIKDKINLIDLSYNVAAQVQQVNMISVPWNTGELCWEYDLTLSKRDEKKPGSVSFIRTNGGLYFIETNCGNYNLRSAVFSRDTLKKAITERGLANEMHKSLVIPAEEWIAGDVYI